MRRFGRFILLAVLGFAIGAAVAWFQGVQEAKRYAASQQAEVKIDPSAENPLSVETGSPVPAEQLFSDTASDEASAKEGAAVTPAPVEATTEATEEKAAAVLDKPAENAATTDVPAGSSVGGAFALTDHNGVAVTEKSWPGKFKLVFFGFTHCPMICPTTLDKLTTVLGTLGDDGQKVQTLFITTDPARDTPEVIKAYLASYNPSIVGLTGTEEQINATKDTFKVYAAKTPGSEGENYNMDHSSFVLFLTPDDQLLDIFKMEDAADNITAKIKERVTATPAAPAASETPPVATPEAAPVTP